MISLTTAYPRQDNIEQQIPVLVERGMALNPLVGKSHSTAITSQRGAGALGVITRAVQGRVLPSASPLQGDVVADELAFMRDTTALPMNDIARLCGLKRRQIYNLLSGEPTDYHRAIRIRAIAGVIKEWSIRFSEPTALRSVLLMPLDHAGRDFISYASDDEIGGLEVGAHLLSTHIARLGEARPISRRSGKSAKEAENIAGLMREIFGEGDAREG